MSSKLQATPPSDDSQPECYYPSCEGATPPLIPVHPGNPTGHIDLGMLLVALCPISVTHQ